MLPIALLFALPLQSSGMAHGGGTQTGGGGGNMYPIGSIGGGTGYPCGTSEDTWEVQRAAQAAEAVEVVSDAWVASQEP